MFNSRDLADRQLLAAAREYYDLLRRRYTIVKLDQPIQRGWRRSYILSPHAATRGDRHILEAILAVIGSVVVCQRPDFRKRPGRRRKLIEIDQPLRPISGHGWDRKHLPDEWRSYFRRELLLEHNRHWQPYWVFREPSLFELKIERNLLWYFQELDPALESRLSELDAWLNARQRWQRYGWLKGCRQRYRWTERETAKQRGLQREHQREIAHACEIFPEVDPAAPKRRARFSFRRIFLTRAPHRKECRQYRLGGPDFARRSAVMTQPSPAEKYVSAGSQLSPTRNPNHQT